VRDGKHFVRVLVLARALESDLLLDKPVGPLALQVLEPGQHPIIAAPKLVGLDEPENDALPPLVVIGVRLRRQNPDLLRGTRGRKRQRHRFVRHRSPAQRFDPLDGVTHEHTNPLCDLQKLLLGRTLEVVQIVVPKLSERRSVLIQSEGGQAGGDLV
jgi:hypothetical protein